MLEIRRIRQTEAETVTDLWDEAARGVPNGGPLRERGRRDIAAMLVLTANSHRAACFVAADGDALRGFVRAAVEWLTAHGVAVIETDVPLDEPRDALWSDLGWARESVRWRIYPRDTRAATGRCG